MRVILDTNVFISGIFFPLGPPRQILQAWKRGQLTLVVSPQILDEYTGTLEDLRNKYSSADATDFLDLVLITSEICQPQKLPERVSEDIDDEIFIACAVASGAPIISGDKHLLKVSGYQNIEILKPRAFIDRYFR